MPKNNLKWSYFEVIHENKEISFENLCRSLFKREFCNKDSQIHSNHNNPGIEVEPILAKDGKTKISFQAKYFVHKIGYDQIKESIKKVIKYYSGKLDTLYLYCNKNIDTVSKSYKEIKKNLEDNKIEIVLINGQTILDKVIDYPQILNYYFGIRNFDNEWFKRNLQLSFDNMGERYNKLFNIDSNVQQLISLFLRNENAIKMVNLKKEKLINELKDLKWELNSEYESILKKLIKSIKSLGDIDVKTFIESFEWRNKFESESEEIIEYLREKLIMIQNELKNISYKDLNYVTLLKKERILKKTLAISQKLDFSEIEMKMINSKIVIVKGEMGVGKSQLLATSAQIIMESSRPTLLILGHMFTTEDFVENQIMKNLLEIDGEQTFDSIVSIMNEKASIIGEDAVIFIDAINESKDLDIWKNGINRICHTIEKYEHIKLMISLRTGFEELVLSEKVLENIKLEKIPTIIHKGFFEDSITKIYEFLSYYGITFSPEYYIDSNMGNPLFLTWFSKTYTGKKEELDEIVGNLINKVDKEASKNAGLKENYYILNELIFEVLDKLENGFIKKKDLLNLSIWELYDVKDKILYLNTIERAGILSSAYHEGELKYFIGYNLLEEYFKASKILKENKNKKELVEYCEKILLAIDSKGNVNNLQNGSIFGMIASLSSKNNSDEIIEVLDKVKDIDKKNILIDFYFSSFIWRSNYIKYEKFIELALKYKVNHEKVWEIFIENSTKEDCELNAIGLNKVLNEYSINKRDYYWTMYINDYNENNRIINLAYYIEEGNKLKGLSENKAYLLSITYTWMLSSTNRKLRDRVSKAIIEILKEHFPVCKKLLLLFKDANDPYIIQRLYGIVFGVVIKRKNKENKEEFKDLAEWIYNEIFNKEKVYPDILLRDYARLIIERFIFEYPNEAGNIQEDKIKPPYNSDPIPTVDVINYNDEKYQKEGLRELLESMKFDIDVKGYGFYGDFGRYVFQSALDKFIDLDKENIYYYSLHYILNELGYDSKRFGQYDGYNKRYDINDMNKIERIGKKYQWIAMYNILARVSDIYNIESVDWNDKIGIAYEGPWNPCVRDFDPTLNTKMKLGNNGPKIFIPKYGESSFCNIEDLEEKINNWIIVDDKMFQDFPNRFINVDNQGKEWVSLYIEQDNMIEDDEKSNKKLRMWSIAGMYIFPNKKIKYKEKDINYKKFDKYTQNDIINSYSLFLREYAWSSGYKSEFDKSDVEENLNKDIFPAAINFLWEAEYDHSQEETTSFLIPTGQILQTMNLYQKEVDGIYYKDEEIVSFDLKLIGNKNKELVIRKEILDEFLDKTNSQLIFKVIGEKSFIKDVGKQEWQKRKGYFLYDKDKIVGSIKLDD